MGIKILSEHEVFFILMRRVNNIAIRLPKKESGKLLYVMSQLENLHYYPNDIRTAEDYPELEFEEMLNLWEK
jgi:hypothetical protein